MHEFLFCKLFRFNDLVYADAVVYTWLGAFNWRPPDFKSLLCTDVQMFY
jgi:hypothetical protein